MASEHKGRINNKRSSAGRTMRRFLEFPGDYISSVGRRNSLRRRRAHGGGALRVISNIAGWLCCAAICAATVFVIYDKMTSPVYICMSIDGQSVGAVDSVAQVEHARTRLEHNITEYTGQEYKLENKISFTLTAKNHMETLDDLGCYDALNSACGSGICEGYVMYADGIRIGSAASEDELYGALRTIGGDYASYLSEFDASVTDARVISEIKIEPVLMLQSELDGAEAIVEHFAEDMVSAPTAALQTFSADEDLNEENNITAEAESNADIPADAEVDTEADAASDAEVDAEADSVDAALSYENNSAPQSGLRYKIVRTETFNEVVISTTERVDDDNLYIGIEKQTQNGEDGIDAVTYRIESINGEEISRAEIARAPVVEMLPTIISVGVAALPDPVPTGTYIWPIEGDIWITSFYGEQREEYDGDSFHYGIDIDCPEGTDVMAADGGTVIYNATTRSYGTMIIIDHQNGYHTCYAHLSETLCDIGDEIYQGQLIAYSGNSGVSTAPHLHYEMRANETTVDPLDYLPYKVFYLERANMTIDIMKKK